MNIVKRKEHFGDRSLSVAAVPADVVSVEDWAFAYCSCLREVRLPAGCEVSDKAFDGCGELSAVYIFNRESGKAINTYPALLAEAVKLKFISLSAVCCSADPDKTLLDLTDSVLSVFLNEDDGRGFTPFLAGGEEDYGDEELELSRYCFKRKCGKIRLIFERSTVKEYTARIRDICADYLRTADPAAVISVLKEITALREDCVCMYMDVTETDCAGLCALAGEDAELRSLIIRYGRDRGSVLDGLLI